MGSTKQNVRLRWIAKEQLRTLPATVRVGGAAHLPVLTTGITNARTEGCKRLLEQANCAVADSETGPTRAAAYDSTAPLTAGRNPELALIARSTSNSRFESRCGTDHASLGRR